MIEATDSRVPEARQPPSTTATFEESDHDPSKHPGSDERCSPTLGGTHSRSAPLKQTLTRRKGAESFVTESNQRRQSCPRRAGAEGFESTESARATWATRSLLRRPRDFAPDVARRRERERPRSGGSSGAEPATLSRAARVRRRLRWEQSRAGFDALLQPPFGHL